MSNLSRVLGIAATWLIGVAMIVLILFAFEFAGLLVLLVLCAIYGWVLYTFLQYRHCRREELLHLLAGAAENELPLAPALRAYLEDRPRGGMREFWLATILFFVLPGYYWIWHRRNSFDGKVERLAQQLELGVPLFQALQSVPRLATRETVLAAAIGQSTGQLGRCLRGAAQRRLDTIWLELIPQIVYPFVMLLLIATLVSFMGIFIVPKFQKIFGKFGVGLPPITLRLINQMDFVMEYWYVVILGVLFFLLLALLPAFSSTVRWYFPGLGAVYRRNARSRVLQALALLLETGQTLPEAMTLMAGLPLGSMVLHRLKAAQYRIEHGEPLADSLLDAGLLTMSMIPLVHAAERAGNLPWALAELADTLYNRTLRVIQRIMQALFPLSVVAVGLLVGYVVVALFIPLVKLVTELSG